MKKVVIIHGNGGCTSQSHWTPWLKAELEKNNIIVVAPTMPDNYEAKASVWLPYMRDVLNCDENTIVVGHSSGAVAAMRYAEKYQLLGTVLVAACYTDLGYESERKAGYYSAPWNWERIKKNQQWIVQCASHDDPYIPIEEAEHIHQMLNSEYCEYQDQGHFMNKTIPDVVALLKQKLGKLK